jgi:hypothetical protein
LTKNHVSFLLLLHYSAFRAKTFETINHYEINGL